MADGEYESALKRDIAIGVLQSQVSDQGADFKRRLERIEKKIDDQSNVSVATFEMYKAEVKAEFALHVTKVENDPQKRIVYGLVALTLIGVATALLSLVVK